MFQLIILPAMSFGLSAASIPGPLQAYLLNVTLRYGWKRGLPVVLAPLIVDGPIILVTVFLLRGLPDIFIQMIRVGGGLLLLFIAWGAWRQLRAGVSFSANDNDNKTQNDGTIRQVMTTAIAMNIFSPGPYLFWGTITGPLLLKAIDISWLAAIGMLLGFYGVFLGGLSLLVFMFHQLGQVNKRMTRIILMVTIALLVWYGTGLIADAFAVPLLYRIAILIPIGLVGWFNVRKINKPINQDM